MDEGLSPAERAAKCREMAQATRDLAFRSREGRISAAYFDIAATWVRLAEEADREARKARLHEVFDAESLARSEGAAFCRAMAMETYDLAERTEDLAIIAAYMDLAAMWVRLAEAADRDAPP